MLKEDDVEWSLSLSTWPERKRSNFSVPSRRKLLGVSGSKWLAVSCCVCRLGFSMAVCFLLSDLERHPKLLPLLLFSFFYNPHNSAGDARSIFSLYSRWMTRVTQHHSAVRTHDLKRAMEWEKITFCVIWNDKELQPRFSGGEVRLRTAPGV